MRMKRRLAFLLYGAALLLLNLPLYKMNGQYCTLYHSYSLVEKSGVNVLSEKAASLWSGNMRTLTLQLYILILFQFISLIYLIVVFFKKRWLVNLAACVLAAANVVIGYDSFMSIFDNVIGKIFPLLLLVLCGMEFGLLWIVKAWREASAEEKEKAAEEKKKKEEKRRRLYFPGNYTKLFYQMIWKNFRYDWKDYGLVLLSSVIASTIVFTGLGCYQMLSGIHLRENILAGQGLGIILWQAMIPFGICTISLMVFVMIFYLKKWIEKNSIFVTLGTRTRAVYLALTLEILFAFLSSLLLGCFLGNALIFLLRSMFFHFLSGKVVLQTITGITYLKMFVVMAAIYIISLLVCHDIVIEFHLIRASNLRIQREKMPRRGSGICSVAGMVLMVGSLLLYSRLVRHESIYLLFLFLLGIYFAVRYGGALLLRKKRQKRRYLRTLMNYNHLYYRSKSAAWYLTALISLSLFGEFYYCVPIISAVVAEKPEELFPYDFVCIADEGDNEFFQNLGKKYKVEIMRYPMVRVANADRTERSEGREKTIQGQQIGISETTYHQLKQYVDKNYEPKNLELDEKGEKVYIVHQQDRSIKAQPLDWTYGGSRPFLHIGLPCTKFKLTTNSKAFTQRNITGEEIGSVIGCFRQGNLENLVVFSDKYFAEAREMWKYTDIQTGERIDNEEMRIEGLTIRQGPSQLVLIQTKKSDAEMVEKEMANFEKNHTYEAQYDSEVSCWYSKRTSLSDIKTERLMRMITNAFLSAILLVTGMFLLYVKTQSEMEEKKDRARFLKNLGMHRKERVRILKKELNLFYTTPAAVTIIATICFTAAVFHARMYPAEVIREYLCYVCIICIGWNVALGMFVGVLGFWTVRKVEGNNE